jgi:TetR/AcrR family tetracycline transcriptional repressor
MSTERLSKDTVTGRALALADALGPDGLTIRRLAQDLGVTPMALYWHFRSKDELLLAVGDRLWGEIDTDLDPAAGWPAQLRGLLESLVATLRVHPSAPDLLLSAEKMHGDAALRATETALDVLRRAGFSPEEATEIARGALWTALTLVKSEPGFGPGDTPEQRAEAQRQHRIHLAMLPPGRFPRLVECAGPMTANDNADFHYRFGVDLFVGGVIALAAERESGSAGAADPAAG